MPNKTLLEYWDAYRLDVIPEGASPVQILETRRAFYAGMASMFDCMGNIAEEDPEAAFSGLKRIEKELMQFATGVGKGN